jgi:hypothetical protein
MVFLVKVHLPPARCPRTNCWAPVAALHPHESGRGGPPRPTEATISRWEWSKWSSRNHGLVGNSPIYWEYSMGFFMRIAKRTYCWFSREFPQWYWKKQSNFPGKNLRPNFHIIGTIYGVFDIDH